MQGENPDWDGTAFVMPAKRPGWHFPMFHAVSFGESLMVRLLVCYEGHLGTDWELLVDQLLLKPHPKGQGKYPERP